MERKKGMKESMRFVKVKVLEKPRRKSGYLEGKLDEFIAMNIPYAQIKFDDDEYCSSHSCTGAYQTAIRRYEKEDILDCRTINGKTFLINKKLGGSLNV